MAFTIKMSFILVLVLRIGHVLAWDDGDMEVFDAVEEVNQNFYEFMGVTQDSTSPELRTAYRNLTLRLHPDKNDSPDADVQFRNLISIYNILKDPGKREKYNEVLKNGLPNWRSAVYYYRHVRKMGLLEMSVILFVIISIGQYIVSWAAYAEKRYFTEQVIGSKLKKMQKKTVKGSNPNNPELTELLAEIPKPSVKNTLPWQITRLVVGAITGFPCAIKFLINYMGERKKRKIEEEERSRKEQERLLIEEEELAKEKELRGLRRRRLGFVPPERTGDDGCFLDPVDEPERVVEKKPAPVVSGGLWTDDDLAELIRLVKKYPGGTSGRWDIIAEHMGRNVGEVTHMAAKLKDNCYRIPGSEQVGGGGGEQEIPGLEVPKKVKTKGGRHTASTASANESVWTQTQQKALEAALAKYPRGGTSDRWDKIAKLVPEKTKEECMVRYKYLVDLVKKQKSDESNEDVSPTEQDCNESSVT